jgi:hypothetical protein
MPIKKRKTTIHAGGASLSLTKSQTAVVESVKGCIARLRRAFGEIVQITQEEHEQLLPAAVELEESVLRLIRDRNVISILGGRGSGKTTVLETALRDLRTTPETIVLRPIYPEAFLVGDHPIGWIAAALRPHVDGSAAELRMKKRADDADQLTEAYNQFNNRVHTFLLAQTQGLDTSGDTMLRKSDMLAAASESGFTLVEKLEELLRRLFTLRPSGSTRTSALSNRSPLLVVSFDDVDLYPERVTRILEVLPVLSHLPRTVVMIAADPSLLRAQLTRGCLELVGKDSQSTGVQLAEDQFMKRMPWDLQFALGDLTLAERWAFRPEGENETLQQVLAGIELRRTKYGPQTLADFFDLSWNYTAQTPELLPTLYTHMLPSDPRALVNLHGIAVAHRARLRSVAGRDSGRLRTKPYQERFRSLVKDLFQFLSSRNAAYLPVLQRVFDFGKFPDLISIDASELVAGINTRTRELADNDDEVRCVRRFYVRHGEEELPQSVAGLLSFGEELDICPVEVGYVQHLSRPGGLSTKQKFLGSEDGQLGWPIPRYDSFLTHEACNLRLETAVQWFEGNEMATELRKIRSTVPQRLLLFYWYCSAIFECVCLKGAPVPLDIHNQPLTSDATWQLLADHMVKVINDLDKIDDTDDDFAHGVLYDLNAWVARDLAWLSADDAARDAGVAQRARWLRKTISDAVPHLVDMLEVGQRESDRYRADLDKVLPKIDLDEIDLQELVNDISAGKEAATRMALLALQLDRRPSKKRDALADIMRQLGHKVPEARSELEAVAGPARENLST